jgi:CRISPR/Cas system-associated exonuclease Cas4 (RecB family)
MRINVGKSDRVSVERFFLEQLATAEPLYPRRRLYGASAAYCPRQNFLYATAEAMDNLTNPISSASSLYMAIGVGIERAIVDGLYRNDRLFFNGLEMPACNPSVGGRIDAVYLNERDQIAIVEIKSCGTLPAKESPVHLAQLLTYSAIAGYDNATLLYISRNVADRNGQVLIRAFPQIITQEILLDTLEKIAMSQLAINEGWLPSIPTGFARDRDCKYCPFVKFCWESAGSQSFSSPADGTQERARQWANKLLEERPQRYVASLRHLYRSVASSELLPFVVSEIERYERF